MNTKLPNQVDVIDHHMIQRMIPHRYPFLLVDKVIRLERGKFAIGLKNVTVNEPYFTGHFPGNPIMPGVAIVEAMAQTAAVLVNLTLDMVDKNIGIYLMAVDNAKFRRMVVPGDQLELYVTVAKSRGQVWKFECQGKVEGKVAAEALITAFWELKGQKE